ncbi:MAG: restriction endonuclease subunit S, partial [Mailhella sp.]|nr:restriction endonuclease subunit S [Mailhella sp.]
MAVQGKLVPQDPNDEPAKALLEKIKAEKAELVKQKKIKADKNPSHIFRGEDNLFYETVGTETKCIQDEIPFDIPDSWEWVRLGEICILNPRNTCEDESNAGFMPMTLLKEGYNNQHDFSIKKWKEIKSGFTHFANDDIVIAKITPCFQNRKSAIITGLPNGIGAGTTELHVIRLFHHYTLAHYILWFVKTAYFIDNGVKAFTGTAGQQRVGKDYIVNILFPFPPLEEQKRIVEKVQSLQPLIAQYAEADTALQNLEKSFPENLKKSLLQWAVQG